MEADDERPKPILDTVLGEISFFRSITRHRPVGIHRHFHVLSMQQAIRRDTGVEVPVDDIWCKLDACYDLEALEGLEIDGYDSTDSDASHPHSIPSPTPGENLMGHPYFRTEYELPWADYDPLIALRRISETSPPPLSPPAPLPTLRAGRRAKGKANITERNSSRRGSANVAGLLGGESDSSGLTSGDEAMDVDSAKPSRRNSVITGTPTEGTMEDEDDTVEASTPVRGRRRGRPPKGTPRGGRGTPTGGRRGRGRR